MDNVQKHINCINIPPSQTFRSYLINLLKSRYNKTETVEVSNIKMKQDKWIYLWSLWPYANCDLLAINISENRYFPIISGKSLPYRIPLWNDLWKRQTEMLFMVTCKAIFAMDKMAVNQNCQPHFSKCLTHRIWRESVKRNTRWYYFINRWQMDRHHPNIRCSLLTCKERLRTKHETKMHYNHVDRNGDILQTLITSQNFST
jgi:hypothetical protein